MLQSFNPARLWKKSGFHESSGEVFSQGVALSKQHLTGCLVLLHKPTVQWKSSLLRASGQTTRDLSSCMALLWGMTAADICTAASSASLCSLIRFYLHNESSVTHSVLNVLNSRECVVDVVLLCTWQMLQLSSYHFRLVGCVGTITCHVIEICVYRALNWCMLSACAPWCHNER